MYNGSVLAEILRSGSARSAALRGGLLPGPAQERRMLRVLLPRPYAMMPAIVSQLVVLLKDTALGSSSPTASSSSGPQAGSPPTTATTSQAAIVVAIIYIVLNMS